MIMRDFTHSFQLGPVDKTKEQNLNGTEAVCM